MKKLPPVRTANIVTQEAGDELMIYDLLADKAFCLNETSAKIYHACDGTQTFGDLNAQYNFSEDLILLALDEMQRNNLLAGEYISPLAGLNRRAVIKKIGLASMVALPVISSLIAPNAAQAASSCICPAATVQPCLLFGTVVLGCFQTTNDCRTAALAAAPTVCCEEVLNFNYSSASGCCQVNCTAELG